MATQPLTRVTPDEYLRFEREAETKHEFIDGDIVSMAGGSERHALVSANAITTLGSRLAGSGCRVYTSDLRVCVRDRLFAYPDVTVVCGPRAFTDERRDTITNPTVLVEVLSPSTRNYDRGEKGFLYRSLRSLREYLIIDPDTITIEHYRRASGDEWLLTPITDAAATMRLESLGCDVPVSDIYRGADL